ncbi:hypothetical protein CUMW_272480 [Citrus unshiu]|uniref:Uncharacterized protein n=1 Tax=Citrus unshiu TaxID=55188 RepID=A0A2H5MV14_CITUN|nr:hypothetical protein CUMW_272480 [Citrus unshiu]
MHPLDLYISHETRNKDSLRLTYSLLIAVLQKLTEIVSALKKMETPYTGKKEWSEGALIILIVSMFDDEKINDNDLDLLAVPQYGRYPDYTG